METQVISIIVTFDRLLLKTFTAEIKISLVSFLSSSQKICKNNNWASAVKNVSFPCQKWSQVEENVPNIKLFSTGPLNCKHWSFETKTNLKSLILFYLFVGMFISLMNFGITSLLCFLYSVGYNLLMALNILSIVPFFIYCIILIALLTLLSFNGFFLLTTTIFHLTLIFLSSCTSTASPS